MVDTGVNHTEFCREQARLFLLNLPSPRFTVPGVAVFPIWESLAMLPVEVFTVFTLFTLFFDSAEERFECKNLFVKVLICELNYMGIE